MKSQREIYEALILALGHVQENFPEDGPIGAAKYISMAQKEIKKLLNPSHEPKEGEV
jgi:hypothetical protein